MSSSTYCTVFSTSTSMFIISLYHNFTIQNVRFVE
nr:MAG TPA: hypothetical protein [Caudoviricetes sp.]